MKKYMILLLIIALFVSTMFVGIGCKEEATEEEAAEEEATEEEVVAEEESISIGIAFPNKSTIKYLRGAQIIADALTESGYNVIQQFAENDVAAQLSQIENLIASDVKVLIVAAVDGSSLTDVLKQAKDAGVRVIAYERLVYKTENVDYYTCFDNHRVGSLDGEYIVEKLDLENNEGPFNIELFAGSLDDNVAYFNYDGAMSVLQPYIDSGKLVVKSGQIDIETCATPKWAGEEAQKRMDNLLGGFYTDDTLSAVFSSYDGMSIGIVASLKGIGFGTPELPFPIVTGQDGELASIKSILAGEQTMTAFKDDRKLALQAVYMVETLLSGEEPPLVDTEDVKIDQVTYDNEVKIVPTFVIQPVAVDADNLDELVVQSGFYTEEEVYE
ncbi:MAG: sugar-binding protein [Actinomycetota bacterium]